MCEPISATLLALGGGLSAVSAIQQGNFAASMARRENQIAQQRANIAGLNAEIMAGQQQKVYQQQLGQGRAAYAAKGVLLEGADSSPMDWQASLAAEHTADIEMIRHNAEMEAWGLRAGGQSALTDGKMAKRAGYMNAAGSVLATAGQLSAKK
jgi:hypothetical protein